MGQSPSKDPMAPPPYQPPDTVPLSLALLDPSGWLCLNLLPSSLSETNFPAAACHIPTKEPPSSSMPELEPSPSLKACRKYSVQKLTKPGVFIMVSWVTLPLKQSAFLPLPISHCLQAQGYNWEVSRPETTSEPSRPQPHFPICPINDWDLVVSTEPGRPQTFTPAQAPGV